MKVSKMKLPDTLTRCAVPRACPYMDSIGNCDAPRTAKGNSDAACHRMGNAELLEYLPPPRSHVGGSREP